MVCLCPPWSSLGLGDGVVIPKAFFGPDFEEEFHSAAGA